MDKSSRYKAVMPVPLRRKQLLGNIHTWVVHQPFFCQFLAVFSRNSTLDLDLTPFFRLMQRHFRYGSVLTLRQQPAHSLQFDVLQVQTTHILTLPADYTTIYQAYTLDRKTNLRRALQAGWTVVNSIDPEPLIRLFDENQAYKIPGGVKDWAYSILRILISELTQRDFATIRYALIGGRIEAGALFVQESNRIIYLFNAASPIGRQKNARTLLIDQVLREKAGRFYEGKPLLFDFESPEKLSIRNFYHSFGTREEFYWMLRWNKLSLPERIAQRLRNTLKKASAND